VLRNILSQLSVALEKRAQVALSIVLVTLLELLFFLLLSFHWKRVSYGERESNSVQWNEPIDWANALDCRLPSKWTSRLKKSNKSRTRFSFLVSRFSSLEIEIGSSCFSAIVSLSLSLSRC